MMHSSGYKKLIVLIYSLLSWNVRIAVRGFVSVSPLVGHARRQRKTYLSSSRSAVTKTSTIPILYESDRLLIVNKPHGIGHHNEGVSNRHPDDEGGDDDDAAALDDESSSVLGIVNLVRKQQQQQQQHGEGKRIWGVHRLDKVTSGILVFAKDAAMAKALTSSFAAGGISKIYMGVSAKRPLKKKQGWIQGGMERSRDKSWKLTRLSKGGGSSSSTTTIANFCKTRFFSKPFLYEDHHKFTLLLFRPYTGKTHQLRVAAKSAGVALWGDPIYKDGSRDQTKVHSATTPSPPTLTADRTYLHASGILIPPLDGEEAVAVWCPPPFDNLVDPSIVSELMHKHCDIPELLEAMEHSPK